MQRQEAQNVERMLRRLIEASEPPRCSEASLSLDSDEVLLDAMLDGRRYRLVRCAAGPLTQNDLLTPREKEIARMVALGYPNKTIAAVLEISSWTVGTHLRHAFAKLGVASRAALVAKLMELDRTALRPEASRPISQFAGSARS